MPPAAPVSPAITARIVHAALVLGVATFWAVAWYIGVNESVPASALPERKVLYIALFVVSAALFAGALFVANQMAPPPLAMSQDDWWRANLGRAITVWALVEAPTILGTMAYLLTDDFRTLIATFTGLLLFVHYRPSRLAERWTS